MISFLGTALQYHCNKKAYLNRLLNGQSRYNLDGTENGTVSEKQANIAQLMIKDEYYSQKESKDTTKKEILKAEPRPIITLKKKRTKQPAAKAAS